MATLAPCELNTARFNLAEAFVEVRKDVLRAGEVLIIPKETYRQHWYRPYRPAELSGAFSAAAREKE